MSTSPTFLRAALAALSMLAGPLPRAAGDAPASRARAEVSRTAAADRFTRAEAREAFLNLPLSFEENVGRIGSRFKFRARAGATRSCSAPEALRSPSLGAA